MPRALLDQNRCRPEACEGGRCRIKKSCAVRAIYQDAPFEVPIVDWGRCIACSRCVAECPAKAVSLVS
jgi:Fe-S-cluster-containing hydrogenase component 2